MNSEDGFIIRRKETGEWVFIEGSPCRGHAKLLSKKETENINACAKRRNIPTLSSEKYYVIDGVRFYPAV